MSGWREGRGALGSFIGADNLTLPAGLNASSLPVPWSPFYSACYCRLSPPIPAKRICEVSASSPSAARTPRPISRVRGGDLDIYTMDVDGKHVKRLTHTLGYDGGPFFSPDGKQIVYRAYHPQTATDTLEYRSLLEKRLVRPTHMDLWVMNADGSGQHQVTHLPGASFAPFFHPDGRRIIFSSNYKSPQARDFDLYLVNADGTGIEQVTTAPGFDAFQMFSPDGTHLVWAS